ncbi:hypothetical protein [Microbacterium marinilacus]|uniref:YbaB/EbfC family DNA-binding protein n=1 Tax=Microbacterium marinilacus TaxID=415209 RepID=A0ABP7BIH9_9MICO|nr:hypothetical protein [Microbacterium marinilacus]MBY0689507.1 hypothetical protein [Microbacterium marinilacus]
MNTRSEPSLGDLVNDLQSTLHELTALAGELQSAAAQRTPVTVSDASQSVTVTLDAAGAVEGIELDEGWRDALGEDLLGDAVRFTYVLATTRQMEQWATALPAEDPGSPSPAAAAAPPVTLGDPTTPRAHAAMDELRDLARRAHAEVDAFDAEMSARGKRESATRSPDATVTVVRTGSSISRIVLDPRWLQRATDGAIERALVDALRSSGSDDPAENGFDDERFPGLQEARNLTGDPRALMRRMGVIL